jgi:hypothetical protein
VISLTNKTPIQLSIYIAKQDKIVTDRDELAKALSNISKIDMIAGKGEIPCIA